MQATKDLAPGETVSLAGAFWLLFLIWTWADTRRRLGATNPSTTLAWRISVVPVIGVPGYFVLTDGLRGLARMILYLVALFLPWLVGALSVRVFAS